MSDIIDEDSERRRLARLAVEEKLRQRKSASVSVVNNKSPVTETTVQSDEVTRLKEEISRLSRNESVMAQALEGAEQQSLRLVEDLAAERLQNAKLLQEISEHSHKTAFLSSEVISDMDQLRSERQELSARVRHLQEVNEALRDERSSSALSTETKISDLTLEISRLTLLVNTLREDGARDAANFARERDAAVSRTRKAEATCHQTMEDASAARRERDEALMRVKSTVSMLESVRVKKEALQKENDELRSTHHKNFDQNFVVPSIESSDCNANQIYEEKLQQKTKLLEESERLCLSLKAELITLGVEYFSFMKRVKISRECSINLAMQVKSDVSIAAGKVMRILTSNTNHDNIDKSKELVRNSTDFEATESLKNPE